MLSSPKGGAGGSGSMGGYDISQSTSNAATAGSRAGEGSFNVYGSGNKANTTWLLALVAGGILLVVFLLKRK